MNDYEKLAFVKSQMEMYSGEFRTTGKGKMICCPYHNDKTPSGLVYLTLNGPGNYRCFGCGEKRNWNELAKTLGLKPVGYSEPSTQYATPRETHEEKVAKKKETSSKDFKLFDIPRNKVWRKIKTNTLISVGCKLMVEYGVKSLYMPVIINNKLRGYCKGKLRKVEGEISYINSPGAWVMEEGLFPFDYSINLMNEIGINAIVLVEGQRDALRLIENGIPAMAVLGTNNWSHRKANLLEISGVETVFLMMDGDPAGVKATDKAIEYLDNVRVIPIRLWKLSGRLYTDYLKLDEEQQKEKKNKLWDPGNCPQGIIDKLKAKVMQCSVE